MSASATVIKDQVILYDLKSTLTPPQWSPNTVKARALLNYKGIPFTTEWRTYTTIDATLRPLGVEPLPEAPHFTLPAITYKGTTVMGSDKIRDFLNKEFPDTPAVTAAVNGRNPKANEVMDWAMIFVAGALGCLLITKVLPKDDAEYFINTKMPKAGVSVPEVLASTETRSQMWAGVESFLTKGIYHLVAASGTAGSDAELTQKLLQEAQEDKVDKAAVETIRAQTFLTGDAPSWVDFEAFGIAFWCDRIAPIDPAYPGGELFKDPWVKLWYSRMVKYSV